MSDQGDEFQRQTWDQVATGTGEFPTVPVSEQQNSKPMMWLIVAYPLSQRGVVLRVHPGQIIGRRGDIRWSDPRMSRQHAQFLLLESATTDSGWQFAIVSHQDRNGTYVNREQVLQTTLIQENDIVTMGDTHFVVKVLE